MLVVISYGLCALARAENVTLLTSYNTTYGAGSAYSVDVAEYDVTVHAGVGAPAGDYILTTTNTFSFSVDGSGNIVLPTYPGGPTRRISGDTVVFIATKAINLSFLVDSPQPGQSLYFPDGGVSSSYSFTLVDSHSVNYWSDTESITAFYFWQTWYGFVASHDTISTNTDQWRQPVTKLVPLDAYLAPHTDKGPPVCHSCNCGGGIKVPLNQGGAAGFRPKGMAAYSFDPLRASLRVIDTPVGYEPPVGPNLDLTCTYDQADLGSLDGAPLADLGPHWTYNWLSYVVGNPDTGTVTRYAAGGGIEHYPNFKVAAADQYGHYQSDAQIYTFDQTSDAERTTQAVLHWDAILGHFTRVLPSGAFELYTQAVAFHGTNLYLLTQWTDPQGNSMLFTYDSHNRLSTVTDAIGQVTTLSYASAFDHRIDHVTDPFGRSVHFSYNAQGFLQSATDPVGIVSLYGYDASGFLNTLTTAYGTTTFTTESDASHHAVESTNPLGQKERIELRYSTVTDMADSEATVPTGLTGFLLSNSGLSKNNTFYWDRRQYTNPPVRTHATVTHWMNSPRGLVEMIDSQKPPLEGRVWQNYLGQTVAGLVDDTTSNESTITARVLDDGSTQAGRANFNSTGLLTQSTDPRGRRTTLVYADNGIDLQRVTQMNGAHEDVISSITYNAQHEPLTITDASGQTRTITYNPQGQTLTSTVVVGGNPQTSSQTYDSSGYLRTQTGPLSGSTTSFAYDIVGRLHTWTDSEGYAVMIDYDDLDRPTRLTYPDTTTDQTFYDSPTAPLDISRTIDRQGRVTRGQYDALRELVQTTDPQGRTIKYGWCTCGGLATLTDPNGNVTTWNHDLEGRITSKIYADSTQIAYGYETQTSRLHQMTDARGTLTTYLYNIDNTVASISYMPGTGVSATPGVSFSYDPIYNRVSSFTDGSGTTSYAYNPLTGSASLGAGQLSSISAPVAGGNATLSYHYDELGRITNRAVDAINSTTTTFDSLGRVAAVTNPLGTFGYAYVNTTPRLATLTYPAASGIVASYDYFDNAGDQRLKQIKNVSGNALLSQFDYTYHPAGAVATWNQHSGSTAATQYALGYDAVDQLTSAVQANPLTSATVSSHSYRYDLAGNRLAETTLSGASGGQYNLLNQLTARSTSLSNQTLSGHTTAPASSVTINSVSATITNATNFTANVPLPGGTNVISVVANPVAPNASPTTQRYQIVNNGPATEPLTYDANGNLLTDQNGTTYQWDALNRMCKMTYRSGASSTFAYDGLDRRVRITENSVSGSILSTRYYLWAGPTLVEERSSSTTVTKQFYPQGERQGTTAYYYTSDHLGSVRELCDGGGNVQSRYDYDPFGQSTLVSGTDLATKQYTGIYKHKASGQSLAAFRNYDSTTGRWGSRDPMETPQVPMDFAVSQLQRSSYLDLNRQDNSIKNLNLNLYRYVENGPIVSTDPSGLISQYPEGPLGFGPIPCALGFQYLWCAIVCLKRNYFASSCVMYFKGGYDPEFPRMRVEHINFQCWCIFPCKPSDWYWKKP